ncbi:TetR/AcrR family transcriptional regulator [Pontibacter sp. 172403-2]|uniref:TetR/AcrR family transcriptional regulator n=1 Tax=Pontibacter rufus TaxID=2791028 RepID=UPI0018AF7678|nr:TetR/AcrR family transcriptional regulator [Pontibacter sp. 172403-2]MBF9253040.1 TetR/AcrR family transcriptional regulator [Pontibacter sp. 172403-2]
MTFLETILEEILRIFKAEGIEANSEADIIRKLDIRPTTYQELFSGKADMVKQVARFDMEQQRREHDRFLATAQSPIEEIMLLLQDGINNIKQTSPLYIMDLQRHYPEVWQLALDHLNSYSYHQISGIINNGILQNLFRRDINIQLVTKIILEQLPMMLNPAIFPPDKYNLGEVFRSIYLYYVRGICTDSGGKMAEEFFSKHNI